MRRHHLPHQPVHVIQRGNNRGTVFFGPQDARRYLDWLTQAAAAEGVAVHAYVLMTNHIHLLASAATPSALGRCMQSVGIRYTRYINSSRRRTGTFWDGPYRAAPVSDERYFLSCSRYIEMNPVRAGLSTTAAAYRWSSYRANADGQSDPLVTPHAIYLALGAASNIRQESYRALFNEEIPEVTVTAIRAATNGGLELSENYTPRARGRPFRTA